MTEEMLAFVIWAAVGVLFIVLGACTTKAKKPQHFWANVKMFEVEDVKGYNRAVGLLFMGFGAVFTALGLPLLCENKLWILAAMPGMMIAVIVMMVIYTTVIEKKYKKGK